MAFVGRQPAPLAMIPSTGIAPQQPSPVVRSASATSTSSSQASLVGDVAPPQAHAASTILPSSSSYMQQLGGVAGSAVNLHAAAVAAAAAAAAAAGSLPPTNSHGHGHGNHGGHAHAHGHGHSHGAQGPYRRTGGSPSPRTPPPGGAPQAAKELRSHKYVSSIHHVTSIIQTHQNSSHIFRTS